MNIQSLDFDNFTLIGKVTFLDGSSRIIKGYSELIPYWEEIRQYEIEQHDLRYQQQSLIQSA